MVSVSSPLQRYSNSFAFETYMQATLATHGSLPGISGHHRRWHCTTSDSITGIGDTETDRQTDTETDK